MDGNGIGDRITEARERKGLNKAELARAVDVKWNTLNNWEAGQHAPETGYIAPLADALGVSADWLLGRIAKDEERNSLGAEK